MHIPPPASDMHLGTGDPPESEKEGKNGKSDGSDSILSGHFWEASFSIINHSSLAIL